MLCFPNAKINIGLYIVRKRADGYHDIETVLYPVAVKDALELTDAPATTLKTYGIPISGKAGDNICFKAYHLLKAKYAIPEQAITLFKNIPIGAGLGGGSADAAFLLRLLNSKFNLHLTDVELEQYARQLGADCAFFIKNEPVYASAKGDEFSPVAINLADYYIVIVKPPVHISTAHAYAGVCPVIPGKPLSGLLQMPIAEWKNNVVNDFEKSLFPKYPILSALKEALYQQGAIYAQMSGSGSAVYGIFEKPVQFQAPNNDCKVFYAS